MADRIHNLTMHFCIFQDQERCFTSLKRNQSNICYIILHFLKIRKQMEFKTVKIIQNIYFFKRNNANHTTKTKKKKQIYINSKKIQIEVSSESEPKTSQNKF